MYNLNFRMLIFAQSYQMFETFANRAIKLKGLKCQPRGRGGCQVVGMFAFYSDDPSSNPAEGQVFFYNFVFEKNENKQKEVGVGPLFKK